MGTFYDMTNNKRVVASDAITKMYLASQMALQRLQMAQQTLQGAQAQFIELDGRLKGALEVTYGPEFACEWEDGKLFVDPHANPGAQPTGSQNGAMSMRQFSRAARRALAKKR